MNKKLKSFIILIPCGNSLQEKNNCEFVKQLKSSFHKKPKTKKNFNYKFLMNIIRIINHLLFPILFIVLLILLILSLCKLVNINPLHLIMFMFVITVLPKIDILQILNSFLFVKTKNDN